jgi:hypothetical protein
MPHKIAGNAGIHVPVLNFGFSSLNAMKFCSECATPVIVTIPPDDTRERFVCPACHTHYQNPKMVVGSFRYGKKVALKILLCRRAIEPRYGYWTLPAGFMENNETTGEAAPVKPTRKPAQYSAPRTVCNTECTACTSGAFVLPRHTVKSELRRRH